jgi:hypothetical protein
LRRIRREVRQVGLVAQWDPLFGNKNSPQLAIAAIKYCMGDGATYPKPKKRLRIWAIVGGGVLGCVLCAYALFFLLMSHCDFSPENRSLGNLTMIGCSTLMYASDWDGKLPLNMSSAAAVEPSLVADKQPHSVFVEMNPAGGSYLGDPRLSGISLAEVSAPEKVVMFFDEKPWADQKVGAFYVDGHAKKSDESLITLQRAAKIELKIAPTSDSVALSPIPNQRPL